MDIEQPIKGPFRLNFLDANEWNATTKFDLYSTSNATYIPDGIFQRFPNLTEISILTKLTTISQSDFKHAKKLTKLRLIFNEIHILSSNVFIELPWLEELDLSGNHITTIEDFAFNGLAFLKNLALRNNYLAEIKRNTFVGLSSLKTLDLSSNEIITIEEYAMNLPHLEQLYIHQNPFVQLPIGFFNGMPNLLDLALRNNNLTTIDSSFYNLQRLKFLKIFHHFKLRVDFEALLRMPALEVLELQGMRVRVPANVTTPPTDSSLIELRLNINDIRATDIVDRLKAFNLRKLQKLNLRSNSLVDVSGTNDLHTHFPDLQELELGGNLMTCRAIDAIAETLKAQSIDMKIRGNDCLDID